MPKICVVGSLNMDLVVTTPKVPAMGETVLGNGFMTVPGGKGANQAVAAARLGGQVAMVGCLGNDSFGHDLRRNLDENAVNTETVRGIEGKATGIAMIVVNEGDNFIIVDPGANDSLSTDMIDSAEKVIGESDMVMVQLEIPMEAVEKAVDLARRNTVKVLLNPAPARVLTDELLKKIDVFTPNESECEIITGITIRSIEDVNKAVKILMKKGIPQVIVTMGGNGVVYNNRDRIIHKTVPKVKVVDTTAAGDSFSGAIAVALSQGKTIDEAIDFANKVGTLTVTKKGAQTSLPTLKEVETFGRIE